MAKKKKMKTKKQRKMQMARALYNKNRMVAMNCKLQSELTHLQEN